MAWPCHQSHHCQSIVRGSILGDGEGQARWARRAHQRPFAMLFWFFGFANVSLSPTQATGRSFLPLGETVAFAADLVCGVHALGSHLRSL